MRALEYKGQGCVQFMLVFNLYMDGDINQMKAKVSDVGS